MADLTIKGTIFKIARFSIHDGPGIRTVIYVKGCPLRCVWCSTPESQNTLLEMAYRVDKCVTCKRCVEVCSRKATGSNGRKILINRQICSNCGECTKVCLGGARIIIGKEVTVGEVIEEVEKDSIFYWNSGGGVTLSGGEPTTQPKFSIEILKACQERGIHTAIETCAYAEWSVLSEILNHLDLVYVDLKHMSSAESVKIVGVKNELILENIQKIAARYPTMPLIIRIPVIPGYNDSVENIRETAQFVRELKTVQRIELLPYHRFGVSQYGFLGREYVLRNMEAPREDHVIDLKDLIRSFDIKVQIGG